MYFGKVMEADIWDTCGYKCSECFFLISLYRSIVFSEIKYIVMRGVGLWVAFCRLFLSTSLLVATLTYSLLTQITVPPHSSVCEMISSSQCVSVSRDTRSLSVILLCGNLRIVVFI